jgi:hypothetical protein
MEGSFMKNIVSALLMILVMIIPCATSYGMQQNPISNDQLYFKYPLAAFAHSFVYHPDYDSRVELSIKSRDEGADSAPVLTLSTLNSKGAWQQSVFDLKNGTVTRSHGQMQFTETATLHPDRSNLIELGAFVTEISAIRSRVQAIAAGAFSPLNSPHPELEVVVQYLDAVVSELSIVQ